MTRAEIGSMILPLQQVFDIVRLVDVSMTTQYSFSPTGEIVREPYLCYAVWNREKRCENCISAKAFAHRSQLTKFEFIGTDVYFVVSRYVEVDDVPYMLEMVLQLSDETLFGAYGENGFVEAITGYNKRLYLDTLTGTYNRLYYNEQLCALSRINAIAMVDIDHFKTINDTYGHPVGDLVLQEVAALLQSHLTGANAVVRFGGDEFLLVFQGISREDLEARLNTIRSEAAALSFPDLPALRTTLSIGAAYSSENRPDLLHEADKALYLAKKERNSVRISDPVG